MRAIRRETMRDYRARALTFSLCVALLAMLGTTACRQITVKTDFDKAASFSRLHSYAWDAEGVVQSGDPRFDMPRLQRRLRAEVEAVLREKGYEKEGSGTPDFLARFAMIVAPETSSVTRTGSFGDPASWAFTGTNVTSYETGTMVLQFVDPASRRPIWTATASGVIQERASPAEREERIPRAVRKMLADFPRRVAKP